ncbi:MAG TPA: porin [Burkholderiaceae bacterium]
MNNDGGFDGRSSGGGAARALALAALLACPGLATAQVDYNVYGVADLSWGRFETSGSIKDDRFNSNSMSATFIGLNLKDALDGGWLPGLTMETFFRFQDFATGRKPNDPLLSRNAFASLGSEYGSVRVGRLQTYLFDTTVRFNALGNAIAFSPAVRHVFQSGNLEGVQGDFYWDRAVSYSTPNLNGFTFNAMGAKGAAAHRGDYGGASAVWAYGLFAGALSVQRVHLNDGINDPTIENTLQAGATYDFGVARVFGEATWTNDIGLGVRSHIFSVGAAIPLGPGTLDIQGAVTNATGLAVDRKHSTGSVAYLYNWDSQTDIYVAAMDDRVRGQTRGLSAAVGVRRKFD